MAGAASSTPRRLAILDRIVDRVSPLPTEDRLPPVVYNPRLVAYVVGVVTVSLVIALNAPRAVTDPGALAVVATASAALGFYSIPALSGIAIVWSVVILLHLIVAFTLGPVGILLMAIAES